MSHSWTNRCATFDRVGDNKSRELHTLQLVEPCCCATMEECSTGQCSIFFSHHCPTLPLLPLICNGGKHSEVFEKGHLHHHTQYTAKPFSTRWCQLLTRLEGRYCRAKQNQEGWFGTGRPVSLAIDRRSPSFGGAQISYSMAILFWCGVFVYLEHSTACLGMNRGGMG